MNYQHIDSAVFGHLFEKGSAGLVGVYAMLLYGRKGYHCYLPYKNENNKITKGKRLISKQSGVSLTALNKHLPVLIDMGLCKFMPCGGFTMTGKKKLKKLNKKKKSVPVRIGKNLRETKGNVYAVPVLARLFRQTKQIDKKITLSKAKCRAEKNRSVSQKDAELLLKAHKSKFIDLDKLKKVENIVLSNVGISEIMGGDCKNHMVRGSYMRKLLENRGFIFSRRRYSPVSPEKISYQQFRASKNWYMEHFGFVTYKNGRVVKPIVSEVMPLTLPSFIRDYNTTYIKDRYTNSINNNMESLQKHSFLTIVGKDENRLQKIDPKKKSVEKRTKPDGSFDFIGWLDDNPEINNKTYKNFEK